MKAVYSKSIHVQRYASGSIWGVVLCKNVATKKLVKLKGTFERFPIEGDMLVADMCEEKHDAKYGCFYTAPLIQVMYPTNPITLAKYLKVTGITNVHGFGEKKLDILLSDPERVWTVLDTPATDWVEPYNAISLDIREKLHDNFHVFKNKTAKSLSMYVSLLMVRLGVKLPSRILRLLVQHLESSEITCEMVESYIHDNLLDLTGLIPAQYVRQLADSLEVDLHTQECLRVIASLQENEVEGHTWTPRSKLNCSDDVVRALSQKQVIFQHGNSVFLRSTYEDEGYIAEMLGELATAQSRGKWVSQDVTNELVRYIGSNVTFTAVQKTAIHNAYNHRVSVLTGGPGTGKTFTIAGILHVLDHCNILDSSVVLLAPTGKAVSRIMSMLTQHGIDDKNVVTSTIHRFNSMAREKTAPVNMVVIDEMSMVDVATFAACLRIIDEYPNAHLVLTGDADQLPSIGCGNVFSDVIKSDVFPQVNLLEVKRQKEGILMSAIKSVRDGIIPRFTKGATDYLYAGEDPIPILREVASEFVDRPQELLIITPTNASISKYQRVVRKVMNPRCQDVNTHISSGDRVMQCVNVYDDPANPVRFNGMIGTIQHIDSKVLKRTVEEYGEKRIEELDKSSVFIEFDNNIDQQTQISYETAKDELEFAYILTVHKSQGSQAKTVIVILDEYFNTDFITRNLLYTAISRAEEKCIIVGSLDTYAHAIKQPLSKRRTCLRKWLLQYKK